MLFEETENCPLGRSYLPNFIDESIILFQIESNTNSIIQSSKADAVTVVY